MLDRARAMPRRIVQRFTRRFTRRFVAATALLSLLVVSAATGDTRLRCRITGILLPDGSCPMADADEGAPTPATADGDGCCDRVVTTVEQTPSETSAPETLSLPTIAVAAADPADVAAAARPAPGPNEQPRAGPPTARARLLSKQSFLI
jgi:hypothetical protein